MKKLVDELESLAESVWFADEGKAAGVVGASEFCHLVGRLGVAIDNLRGDAKVRHDAALEAYWADKARDFAKAAPESEHAVRTVDENMAISRAAVGIETEYCKFLRLLDAFALEFLRLATRFFHARFKDGDVSFKCHDLVACKKQAESLKRLAGAVEEFEHGGCNVEDIHAAIIAYTNEVWGSRAAK